MIQLRPYQSGLIKDIRQQFREGARSVIMCLPTGGGKTVVFSYMVQQALQKDPAARVLILTDREELLRQAGGTLQKFGMQAEYIKAGQKYINPHARLYVGMVETVNSRKERLSWLFDVINLVIIDEAHKGNFRKILPHFDRSFVIGATATPISASKKHPLNESFERIAVGPQIPELIEEGYLSPARTFTVQDDLSDLKVSSSGDYTGKSLNDHFNKHELRAGVVKQYKEKADHTKTLVFCVGVDHARETAAEFRAQGYSARVVDGKTPDHERAQALLWLKNTPGAILCNCGVLTTGFDEPSLETIIVNRATKSLTLWLQMTGRGGRKYEGKKQFTLLDLGANVIAGGLGLWEQERNWANIFYEPEEAKKKKGGAAYKECPKCGALAFAAARSCLECGHEYAINTEKETQEAELVEVDSEIGKIPDHLRRPKEQLSIIELMERARYGSEKLGRPYKNGWIVHELRRRGEAALREYAALMGYKSGWVNRQLNY